MITIFERRDIPRPRHLDCFVNALHTAIDTANWSDSAVSLASLGLVPRNDDRSRCYFFALRFFAVLPFFFEAFFGTFFPSALASDRPIAIACLRLMTFLPDRPLFKVPSCVSS